MAKPWESEGTRKRRMYRRIALGMLAAAAGGVAAGWAYKSLASYRFMKELGESKDWTTGDSAKKRGIIPAMSHVLRGGNPDSFPKSGWRRKLADLLGLKPTHGAEGSACLGNPYGIPIFYLGPDHNKINERVTRHEGGHYSAQRARKRLTDYIGEYNGAKERAGGWSDIFHPGRIRDGKGRLTLVGLEQEAWDRGGVPASDKLRQAAVGTYKAHTAVRSLNRYLKLTALASVVPGAMSLGDDDEEDKLPEGVSGIPPSVRRQMEKGKAIVIR